MDNRKHIISKILSRFRGWIQAAAALLTNPHLPNFFKGGIYQGKAKAVCVPGLNCYSCPAAAGACPIGSFQAVVGSSKFSFSYYITGFLILVGVLLGRFICGFLCPFGWLQDLLHKIPGKKLSTERLKPLTYLKYAVLFFTVIALPALRAKRDRIDAAPPGRARVPGGDPRDDPRGRGVLAAACARRPPVGSAGNGVRADILRRMAGQRCTCRQMKNLGSDPIPAAAGLRLEPRAFPSRAAHLPTLSTTPYQSASRSPLPASPSAPADVTTSTSLRAGSTKTFCPRSPHSANWRSRPDDTIQVW